MVGFLKMVAGKEIRHIVSKDSEGQRVDKCVSVLQSNLSRSFIQDLIRGKNLLVNSKTIKPGQKLKLNDEILILLPELKEQKAEPENIKLSVVYEDNDLIVINKPLGMVTHPASGVYSGTLVNALLYHCKKTLSGINGVLRPGIVHRLDKDTSGLIIVCKNDVAHREIAKQIKDRKAKRIYLAVVHGKLLYDKGTVNKPIGRDKIQRHKMAVVLNGKPAITHWKILKRLEGYTFLECSLETGRTHQIRVHMKSIGYPILGDKTYGKKNDKSMEMMLHAYKLSFVHPRTKKEVKLETEVPERFKEFL